MADLDKPYMYMIKAPGSSLIGFCLTRDAAMEYVELCANAHISRTIFAFDAFVCDDPDDYIEGWEYLSERSPDVFEKEFHAVYDFKPSDSLALFFSLDSAMEYCRVRTDAGKPSTVMPFKLPDPDTVRERMRAKVEREALAASQAAATSSPWYSSPWVALLAVIVIVWALARIVSHLFS